MVSRSSESPALPAVDALSEVLHDLRLSGVSYGRCELSGPWGIEMPPANAMRFHFVAAGACWLYMPALGWRFLSPGDIALVPRGTGHTLADAPPSEARSLDELPVREVGDRLYRVEAGGGGERSLLFCCTVTLDQPGVHPLLELMPPALLVSGAAMKDPTLPVLLETMAEEVVAERMGATTVLARLADVVIARVIRSWVEHHNQQLTGWLAAIRDPKMGRALAAIHREPGRRWSVESLAQFTHCSRSMFIERFTSTVGVAPSRYIAQWRMQLAREWLRDGRTSVAQAALRLGYESESSFSRAFKRYAGVPPSSVLKRRPCSPGCSTGA